MLRVFLISLVVVLGLSGCNSSEKVSAKPVEKKLDAVEPDMDKIRAAVQIVIPGVEADSITPSPIDGIYEVVVGLDVFYLSADGRYFMNGSLVDIKEEKNLTEDKRAAGRIALINSVDESNMIIFSPEEVKYRVTVFTDIDCMYCRRMHTEIDELNTLGIEVRYLFFPRAGLNSKSYNKAVSVWCADNRQEALTQAKLGKLVEEKTCDNPVDEHMELVRKLGLTGTPASVLSNGQIAPGYLPADRYVEMLKEAASS